MKRKKIHTHRWRGHVLYFQRPHLNHFSTTRRYKRHQNKVRDKGLGTNSSYLAGFSIFFFPWLMKKFNQLAKKKNYLKFFSLAWKLKQLWNFLKKKFFFFSCQKSVWHWKGQWNAHSYYSQIHPALQQIPAYSTLELCLWLVSSR